jgi:7-cyano-7-deazaguanine synthase
VSAALLLSGGQDSAALAYWLRPRWAITLDYGQVPAEAEIAAAGAICRSLTIDHVIVRVDCSSLGSGDLAGTAALAIAPASEWWPYRNQLLLTLAGSAAIARGAKELLIGSVSTDAFHADGTAEFIRAMSDVFALQEGNLRVRAPAIEMTSSELVRNSGIPLELLAWSHSCHTSRFACGTCRGCIKHKNVMHELGHEPY